METRYRRHTEIYSRTFKPKMARMLRTKYVVYKSNFKNKIET